MGDGRPRVMLAACRVLDEPADDRDFAEVILAILALPDDDPSWGVVLERLKAQPPSRLVSLEPFQVTT